MLPFPAASTLFTALETGFTALAWWQWGLVTLLPGLPPAYEGTAHVGYLLGGVILMLKADAAVTATAMPNPRITLDTENARQAEAGLRARGVAIGDPVARYGELGVGSFLDSEGNKLWFCSAV